MSFSRHGALFASGLAILLVIAQAEPTTKAQEGLRGLVFPLDKPSLKLEAAQKMVKTALAELPGEAGRAPEFVVTKSGQGVLWGDLFKTGGCFALAELTSQAEAESESSGAVFAEWREGGWQLRQVWDILVIWRTKGWKESGKDYLPATPASEPFLLEDFSGDGVPEVVVAGGVWKYFQENYLMRFVLGTKELKLVGYAMAKPERIEGYVQLYFNSVRRSIWEEWEYCKWKGDELVTVASWHSETGYNENDPTFSEGMRIGRDGEPVTIRVLYGHGQEIENDSYELIRNGQPFGTMRIAWKDEEHRPTNADEMEAAWLFEKITGLPRQLYPAREDAKPIAKFEGFATVRIKGNDEAAKLFETGR